MGRPRGNRLSLFALFVASEERMRSAVGYLAVVQALRPILMRLGRRLVLLTNRWVLGDLAGHQLRQANNTQGTVALTSSTLIHPIQSYILMLLC